MRGKKDVPVLSDEENLEETDVEKGVNDEEKMAYAALVNHLKEWFPADARMPELQRFCAQRTADRIVEKLAHLSSEERVEVMGLVGKRMESGFYIQNLEQEYAQRVEELQRSTRKRPIPGKPEDQPIKGYVGGKMIGELQKHFDDETALVVLREMARMVVLLPISNRQAFPGEEGTRMNVYKKILESNELQFGTIALGAGDLSFREAEQVFEMDDELWADIMIKHALCEDKQKNIMIVLRNLSDRSGQFGGVKILLDADGIPYRIRKKSTDVPMMKKRLAELTETSGEKIQTREDLRVDKDLQATEIERLKYELSRVKREGEENLARVSGERDNDRATISRREGERVADGERHKKELSDSEKERKAAEKEVARLSKLIDEIKETAKNGNGMGKRGNALTEIVSQCDSK